MRKFIRKSQDQKRRSSSFLLENPHGEGRRSSSFLLDNSQGEGRKRQSLLSSDGHEHDYSHVDASTSYPGTYGHGVRTIGQSFYHARGDNSTVIEQVGAQDFVNIVLVIVISIIFIFALLWFR